MYKMSSIGKFSRKRLYHTYKTTSLTWKKHWLKVSHLQADESGLSSRNQKILGLKKYKYLIYFKR